MSHCISLCQAGGSWKAGWPANLSGRTRGRAGVRRGEVHGAQGKGELWRCLGLQWPCAAGREVGSLTQPRAAAGAVRGASLISVSARRRRQHKSSSRCSCRRRRCRARPNDFPHYKTTAAATPRLCAEESYNIRLDVFPYTKKCKQEFLKDESERRSKNRRGRMTAKISGGFVRGRDATLPSLSVLQPGRRNS